MQRPDIPSIFSADTQPEAAREIAIFGPLVFPLFALVHLVLAIVTLQAWSAAPLAAACLALVEFITFFDNAVVGLGNRIGISDFNRGLNRMRFFLHAVFIAGLIPAYAGIGQLAGASGFDSILFNIMVGALTACVVLFGYFIGYRPLKRIMPANYYGCLRYVQAINDNSRLPDYNYTHDELEQKGFPPFTSIITVLIGLLMSLWIGFTADFWLPTIVTGLMMTAGRFPGTAWGALATSCLEIIFSAGIVYSLVSLAGS